MDWFLHLSFLMTRTVWVFLSLALASAMLNTAVAKPSDFRSDLEKELDAQVERAEVLLQAGRLYDEADRLIEQGEREKARGMLARARDTIVGTNEEVFYQPNIYAYFIKISNRISELGDGSMDLFDAYHAPADGRLSVARFLAYFQDDGKRLVQDALKRLAPNEAMFRERFRAENVPESLIYLGLIESGFDPVALSPAGARGTWQFMKGTGLRYGLSQAAAGDERTDTAKSTRAAARYLSDLNRIFGDWLLALAAYNAGEHRILRITEKTGIRDFWELRRRGLLPKETSDYVPAVLAAVQLLQGKTETAISKAPAS